MTKNEYLRKTLFVLAAILTIFFAHHSMVLLHEWTHGTAAWAFGYKDSPFNIKYGGWRLKGVDEAVDYDQIMQDHKPKEVAIIAGSALVMNGLLFILSIFLL